MKRPGLVLSLLLLIFLSGHRPAGNGAGFRSFFTDPKTGKTPKNIILMIGDGMGLTQVTAAMYSKKGQSLHIERCPVTGLIKTHSSKNLITDSAAGATAFSCGCKTYNGAIGLTDDKKPCRTILEEAESQGLATGLVATSSITHATPAAFIAHEKDRSMAQQIAQWFLKTDIELFIGGGMKNFNERTIDNRNLCTELDQKGFQLSDYTKAKLEDLAPSPAKPFAWFSSREEPISVKKGRTYLPYAGKFAPDFLKQASNGKGFFLMIEGSQIDWGGHAKNAETVISETLDFDETIGNVLDFAEKDGETLVIITADHETGGMAILYGSTETELDIKFNSDYHTAVMVPVFAFGPGAEQFSGVYENTDIYWKMRELFKFPATAEIK